MWGFKLERCAVIVIVTCSFYVNYLIDEAVKTGKGSNAVISMLHHFLETYSMVESFLHLHVPARIKIDMC